MLLHDSALTTLYLTWGFSITGFCVTVTVVDTNDCKCFYTASNLLIQCPWLNKINLINFWMLFSWLGNTPIFTCWFKWRLIKFFFLIIPETATGGILQKKVFQKISHISEKNTCWSLRKHWYSSEDLKLLLKRDSNTGAFLWNLKNV